MLQICRFAINKSQNGYFSSSQFNLLVNQAQDSYLDYLVGEFQQYQYGRAKARVSYSQNSIVRQRVSPLIYGYNLSVDNNGFSRYPDDYLMTDSMLTFYGYNRIRYVQQDYLFSYYNSKIDPVNTNPVYLIEDDGFRFFPSSINSAKLSYIRKPTRIWWGYDLDQNGREVYNPSKSEQPVWSDLDILEIIARVLKLAGVSLKDGDVISYANQITQIGQ